MRILVAPGSFGTSLSAVAAATAIATGWASQAPEDELVLAPVSDGGVGFVDVLRASLGGALTRVTVADLYGEATAASVLVAGDTAYVEAAQLVGRQAGPAGDPERATSLPVGLVVVQASALGASRVVVGVGTGAAAAMANDGGAGVLAGLGATSDPADALSRGVISLDQLQRVELRPAVERLAGTTVVLATDDDTPLLGLMGTTNTAGVARGLAAERLPLLDRYIEGLAELVGRRHALARSAGAGGGVGFGLLVAGAVRAPGLASVTEAIGLAALAARADLVVTGEQALDFTAGSGRLSGWVAQVAGSAVRPCIALANEVLPGSREIRAMGIESAYGVRDLVADYRPEQPAEGLAALAQRVAKTWSWSR